MKILDREPAVVLGVVSAALSLVVTFNIGLSPEQAGGFVAVISGVFAAISAWATKPITPSAFTDLLAAFHFEVPPQTVGALNALVLAVLVLLTRGQVSPAPVSVRRPLSGV